MGFNTLVRQSEQINLGSPLTITTTGNIDDLAIGSASMLLMNNAADATIRGMVPNYSGQSITIVSIGAGHVYLANQNAGSSAANRLINPLTTAAMPLAAGAGIARYQYDSTTSRWRQVSFNQGKGIDVPYSAGNFTSSAGTFTVDVGDQLTYNYIINPSGMMTLYLFLFVFSTNGITAASANIRIAIPGGWTIFRSIRAINDIIDNGTGKAGLWDATTAASVYVACYTDVLASGWADSVNNSTIFGKIDIPIS